MSAVLFGAFITNFIRYTISPQILVPYYRNIPKIPDTTYKSLLRLGDGLVKCSFQAVCVL